MAFTPTIQPRIEDALVLFLDNSISAPFFTVIDEELREGGINHHPLHFGIETGDDWHRHEIPARFSIMLARLTLGGFTPVREITEGTPAVLWTEAALRGHLAAALPIIERGYNAMSFLMEDLVVLFWRVWNTDLTDTERETAQTEFVRLESGIRNSDRLKPILRARYPRADALATPPETDLPAYRQHHVEALVKAAEDRRNWLLGDPPWDTSSQETIAVAYLTRSAREYGILILRAATATAVREIYARGRAALAAIGLGAGPQWKAVDPTGGLGRSFSGAYTFPAVLVPGDSTPPAAAGRVEAYTPGAEPSDPPDVPTIVESAVSAVPSELRATIRRGSSDGIDYVDLAWLNLAPVSSTVEVLITARNATGRSRVTVTVPAPVAAS